jgi:hypothetical protein
MHTFEWEDEWPKEDRVVYAPDEDLFVYVNHNSDNSGDAIVSVPTEMWEQIQTSAERHTSGAPRVSFKLPARLLADFSKRETVREMIDALKDML